MEQNIERTLRFVAEHDPEVAEASFENVNDRTNEGITCRNGKAFSVQFYPEASAGVQSSSYLYDLFIEKMGGNQ